MNTKLMISVLRGAPNGRELLKRLEAITDGSGAAEQAPAVVYGSGQPTLEEVAF
jgi:hypothetical protein